MNYDDHLSDVDEDQMLSKRLKNEKQISTQSAAVECPASCL